MQALLDGRVGGDVEVDEGEDVAGCDGAGADDGLGFVLEVVGLFFFGADVGVGENVVEDVGLAGGFGTW